MSLNHGQGLELGQEIQQKPTISQQLNIVAESACWQEIIYNVEKVAPTNATVLILGESGSGKEVLANLIHKLSPRAGEPFISVNCAALPEGLIESQLFGHEKGSFTGASSRSIGFFEQAHRGTIFLDEIGEMPAPMQTRLLRVLEESKLRRIGGPQEITVDVRVLSATNININDAVASKKFRKDLYFRLSVFPINLPPLCERKEDVIPLIEFHLRDLCLKHGYDETPVKFVQEKDGNELLQNYAWPGNVRELRNFVERALILACSDNNSCLTSGDLAKFLPKNREIREKIEEKGLSELAVAAPLLRRLLVRDKSVLEDGSFSLEALRGEVLHQILSMYDGEIPVRKLARYLKITSRTLSAYFKKSGIRYHESYRPRSKE